MGLITCKLLFFVALMHFKISNVDLNSGHSLLPQCSNDRNHELDDLLNPIDGMVDAYCKVSMKHENCKDIKPLFEKYPVEDRDKERFIRDHIKFCSDGSECTSLLNKLKDFCWTLDLIKTENLSVSHADLRLILNTKYFYTPEEWKSLRNIKQLTGLAVRFTEHNFKEYKTILMGANDLLKTVEPETVVENKCTAEEMVGLDIVFRYNKKEPEEGTSSRNDNKTDFGNDYDKNRKELKRVYTEVCFADNKEHYWSLDLLLNLFSNINYTVNEKIYFLLNAGFLTGENIGANCADSNTSKLKWNDMIVVELLRNEDGKLEVTDEKAQMVTFMCRYNISKDNYDHFMQNLPTTEGSLLETFACRARLFDSMQNESMDKDMGGKLLKTHDERFRGYVQSMVLFANTKGITTCDGFMAVVEQINDIYFTTNVWNSFDITSILNEWSLSHGTTIECLRLLSRLETEMANRQRVYLDDRQQHYRKEIFTTECKAINGDKYEDIDYLLTKYTV